MGEFSMLSWAILFLVMTFAAAIIEFSGIAGAFFWVAHSVFVSSTIVSLIYLFALRRHF
jgi:uncharacterized membrane protein YtjA (UPF0391 family)